MRLTRPELATIAHACDDWASNYFHSPIHGGKDAAVRYIADHHLGGLTTKYGRPKIWDAVAAHLDANPDTLTAPRTTIAERSAREDARNARATEYLNAALHHHKAAEPYEALALIDRAELASPTFKDFSQHRAAVRKKTPPFPSVDLSGTGLRYRAPLPLAGPLAGPPVAYHGLQRRHWVYPGRPVVEGDWPAATPEMCTVTDAAPETMSWPADDPAALDTNSTQWLADGLILVCNGCGLAWT
ncbi:hypothetical protein [Micromonospora sp. NPDC048843]|uniref:hypothetical protein n=1 Tax=Micromonospora sp. NPDC048843 TaxID=3155389 RepID=UPI0033F9A5C5